MKKEEEESRQEEKDEDEVHRMDRRGHHLSPHLPLIDLSLVTVDLNLQMMNLDQRRYSIR